jgi:hypothetical protein
MLKIAADVPVFNIKLEEPDLEILKETGSLQVFDVETSEETGEFDYPDDLVKSHHPSLNANLQKEAQKEGLNADSYTIKSFLVLAKTEDDVNEYGFLQHEDATLVATVEIGKAEVNGLLDWNIYLLGVLA